jgi:hypothetical protein
MEIGKKLNIIIKILFIFIRYQHTSIDPDDPPLDKLSLNNIRHPYRTIGCLFNDRSFYANIQV